MPKRKAIVALEDGACFEGRAFAGHGEVFGELVFNTSMTGYQEILTDPSYHGQVVTLTYPLIGNYGVSGEDLESARPRAAALVVGECSRVASNRRADGDLAGFLEAHGLIGVDRVDTRAITLHIRSRGALKCIVSTEDGDRARLVARAAAAPGLVGRDLAREVSTPEPYRWPGPHAARAPLGRIDEDGTEAYHDLPAAAEPRLRIAVLDCGAKFNQLRLLGRLGADLDVFPIATPAEAILAARPDGFFISNGPGDPEGCRYAAEAVRAVVEAGVPTFGICFGHQLLGLALGGRTFKLKFGHRGANQPVLDRATGRVEITSQNHGFCVDLESLDAGAVETTHVNLNDGTSEGLRHLRHPCFSVQYHPEAAPGPHDSTHLFGRFLEMVTRERSAGVRA